jgi:hypothetical protein
MIDRTKLGQRPPTPLRGSACVVPPLRDLRESSCGRTSQSIAHPNALFLPYFFPSSTAILKSRPVPLYSFKVFSAIG